MSSFLHAGDIGDIIYALPTVKGLGGGVMLFNHGRARNPMNDAQIEFLKELLLAQPYIYGVDRYRGESVCYDLNTFREYWLKHSAYGVSIAEWHCRAFGVDVDVINSPWLTVTPEPLQPVVIHRSTRYHNEHFPWLRIVRHYRGKLVFVGLEEEHRVFCREVETVPFYKVRDALEMAEIIAGAKLFVGNQSFPNALAEGLKIPKILEVSMVDPNCCFERPDAQYIFTRNVWLPKI